MVSGGVDSSFSLYLLKRKGFDVVSVFLWMYDGQSFVNAEKVSKKLGVPFLILDVRKEFKEEVIKNFIEEYKRGRTPNPCVICNERVKFNLTIKKILQGEGKIATGHYARIEEREGRFLLKKSLYKDKDQSYMLYRLKQWELERVIFPLGNWRKSKVKEKVLELKLLDEIPPESQDVCFVYGGKDNLVKERIGEREGLIVHVSGKVLGKHRGIQFFTIGQRSGLDVSWSEPLYVVKIIPEENKIIVGEKRFAFKKRFVVNNLNWIYFDSPPEVFNAKVKTRYKGEEREGKIRIIGEDRVEVSLKEEIFAVTPGQSAVFYKDDYVIGGGIIDEVE